MLFSFFVIKGKFGIKIVIKTKEQRKNQRKNIIGTIQNINKISKDVYSVEIYAPTVNEILPGQYISILCEGLTLRRPFSVADFENNIITLLIKKRGKGTEFILSKSTGDNVEFSAPLGNGFDIKNEKTLLIGAGIGVAPMFYLNKKLQEIGAETFLASGFLSEADVLKIDEYPMDFISTDDGSNGNKGSICDFLETIITDFKPERIVSCAPHTVLKLVAQSAQKYKIKCEVCMEKVMACGIGVCRGCVIKIKKDDKIQNATVCKDGPVFKSEEVVW